MRDEISRGKSYIIIFLLLLLPTLCFGYDGDSILDNVQPEGGGTVDVQNIKSVTAIDDTTEATLESELDHDDITGAGTVDTAAEVQGVSVGGDLSGTVGTAAVTDDSHNHTGSTISGIDISDDTNLAGTLNEITLTDDTLSLHADITRDAEWDTEGEVETVWGVGIYTVGEKVGDADTLDTHDSTYFAVSGGVEHDGFSDFVANEHIDWTVSQAPTVIHADNYTDTTYSAGTGLDLTTTTFSLSHLGLESLTDPNADRILYWNDTSNATDWLDYSAWDTNASDDFSGSYNDLTDKPTNFDDDDVTDDNVESMTTAGGAGTAPVSDGAGNLTMTDVWTEAENTAAGYISSETDDQTIDVFSFDGTNISLSLENDGEATKTLDISSVDTDTTYTAGGTLLDLTGTTVSLNEGTLTDTKYCTYEAGTGLVCNSDGGSMTYPAAGIAVSTGAAWDTSLSASWLDQDVSQDGTPTFASASLGTGELTAGSINCASGTLTLGTGGATTINIASGRLGVGIAPSRQFHVSGSESINMALLENTSVSGFSFLTFQDSGTASNSTVRIGSNGNDLVFQTNTSGSGLTRLRIDDSGDITTVGNLTIGDDSDFIGTDANYYIKMSSGSGAWTRGYRITNNAEDETFQFGAYGSQDTDSLIFGFAGSAYNDNMQRWYDTYTQIYGNLIIPDAGYIGSASDTAAIMIAANGEVALSQNLGIGINNPRSKLDLGFNYGDPGTSPNKIILYQNGDYNYFGFGISTSTLDYFSQQRHRWHTEYDGTAGSVAMMLDDYKLFINDTSNSKMNAGLTINQGDSDFEIVALKSSDVDQPWTNLTEADTFGVFKKPSAGGGGLGIYGLSDTNISTGALRLLGFLGTTNPTDTYPAVRIDGYKSNGSTGGTSLADAERVMEITNAGTTKWYINGNGDVTNTGDLDLQGGQLSFPATQNASSDANTLDDYEEGTYTPTVTCSSSGDFTLNSSFDAAGYIKTGARVHTQGYITITADNSCSGVLKISIPFTRASLTDAADYSAGTALLSGHGGDIPNNVAALASFSDSFTLAKISDAGSLSDVTEADVDGAWNLYFTLDYIASD